MAKNNKTSKKNKFSHNTPTIPVASNAQSFKAAIPKIAATMDSARSCGVSVSQEMKFDETLADQFSKALPTQDHDALRAWLEQFATLGKTIKDKIAEVEKKQQQFEKEQRDLLEKQDELKKDREVFAKESAELKPKLEEYKAANTKLLERERELEVRELDARTGFAYQNETALKNLKENIGVLEKQRDSLKHDIERADQKLTDLQQKKDEELHQRELKLSMKESRVQRALNDIDIEQENYKKELSKQFEVDCQRWDEKIAQANRRAEAAFDQADEAEKRLYEYRDLMNALNGRNPQSLLDELEALRQEKRHLKSQINNSDIGSLDSENDGLKSRVQNLESRLREVEPELEHAKSELSRQRIGVAEKQSLVEERLILEKHKQVLTAHVNELSTKIDQLTNAQKAQTPFPALDGMDKTERFQVKPHLDEVSDLKTFAPELQRRIAYAEKGVYLNYKLEDIQILLGGLAMSQLHVFQGISGTGKTSLAKAFAKAMGGYCTDIAVQAGWRDRDDLLGHYNAFEKRFYEKDCLQGLYRAQTPAYEDCCNIILLDEMNLSRPEQYFAEFLSALEKNDSNERLITLMESSMENSPKRLAEGRKIRVPKNIWFIGTANHDETTNELADKTYDRAHIMVLPRHETSTKLDKIDVQRFSYASLRKRFDEAIKANKQEVTELLEELTTGSLTTVLEEHFNFGWGNRFERQAKQFIPVVMAAGGNKEMALDHLLATRVFRNGKVTGRYDVNLDALGHVEKALNNTWKSWKTPPTKCREALEQDRSRKERGV